MLQSVFLEELQELLQRDDPVEPDMKLKDLDEWDSLAIMSCMAYFDKNFNLKIKMSKYEQLSTVSDLIDLAGTAIV